MLHPKQFSVNEAWIAFRLNDGPIRTQDDGDFNCLALMDAASCFILSLELISAAAVEPSGAEFRRLLKNAESHKQQLPKKLLVPSGDVADVMTSEATRRNVEVVRVPESELVVFTEEARQAFAEQFEDQPT